MEALIRSWPGEQVVCSFVRDLDAWIFICVHKLVDGSGGGGTRMRVYATPRDGLEDAMRLAEAMTAKMAGAGMGLGGGKAVIAMAHDPSPDARRELLDRYAELVNGLDGRFLTGPDVGTTEADMDYLRPRCEWIFGSARGRSGARGISESTALGVFHGIGATVAHLDAREDLAGVRVVVQGTGAVGGPLAELLAGAGADVVVTDVDEARLARVARELGATAIAPEEAVTAECDVCAPCAVGGVIGPQDVAALRCRAVAGSANNPLAGEETPSLLRARGILYAPDFVINAGGVLHGLGIERHGWSDDELVAQLEQIGARLRSIYAEADANDVDPLTAARRLFGSGA